MKTKYRHMKFEKEQRPHGDVWNGWSKRHNAKTTFICEDGPLWVASHSYPLTADEHRDIADFLSQLNREGKP